MLRSIPRSVLVAAILGIVVCWVPLLGVGVLTLFLLAAFLAFVVACIGTLVGGARRRMPDWISQGFRSAVVLLLYGTLFAAPSLAYNFYQTHRVRSYVARVVPVLKKPGNAQVRIPEPAARHRLGAPQGKTSLQFARRLVSYRGPG